MTCYSADVAKAKDDARKTLVRNKRVRHDYEIEQTIEAGIVLKGSEVKSLRAAEASLTDAYALEKGGEMWLIGAQIQPYPFANTGNHEPRRERRLLLHKQEIKKLAAKMQEKDLNLIPSEIYVKDGKIKVELALGRGRRDYEKRHAIRKKEDERDMERKR